jgi:hypothetical protein
MRDLDLTRFCYAPNATFGSMIVDGIRLFTIENPWLDNRRGVSCIPEGEYVCRPRHFHRGDYPAIEILDIPDRSHILFHKANVADDVNGCIGVGVSLGCLSGKWAVRHSSQGFAVLMKAYGTQSFNLRILPWKI